MGFGARTTKRRALTRPDKTCLDRRAGAGRTFNDPSSGTDEHGLIAGHLKHPSTTRSIPPHPMPSQAAEHPGQTSTRGCPSCCQPLLVHPQLVPSCDIARARLHTLPPPRNVCRALDEPPAPQFTWGSRRPPGLGSRRRSPIRRRGRYPPFQTPAGEPGMSVANEQHSEGPFVVNACDSQPCGWALSNSASHRPQNLCGTLEAPAQFPSPLRARASRSTRSCLSFGLHVCFRSDI
jgi:hypothetical protein